jgi:hypothetical protein
MHHKSKEPIMSNHTTVNPFLRFALRLDAAVSGTMGLLLTLASEPVAKLFSMPATFIFVVGMMCLPFSAALAWLSAQAKVPTSAVWIVIGSNAAWVIASILLLVTGLVTPNAMGSIFVIGQAAMVGLFAELQFIGMRKARAGEIAHA